MKKRTVIISEDNQCVQNIQLDAGRYTINFSIRTFNTSHKIAFKKKSGVWEEFEITDLIPAKWKKKARLTFFLDEDAIAFNLCTSPVSPSSPVMIQDLMLEEGLNASTAKPNELDLLESIQDTFDIEHIFKPLATLQEVSDAVAPESVNQDDHIPEGWFDDPISATPEMPYVIHTFRQRIGMTWGTFVKPVLYSNYAESGAEGKSPYIDGETGTWWEWSVVQEKYVDTGIRAKGDDAKSLILTASTPYMLHDYKWNIISGQTINITVSSQNLSGNPTIEAKRYNNVGNYIDNITLGGSGSNRTLTSDLWVSGGQNLISKVVITATYGELSHSITIERYFEATPGLNVRDLTMYKRAPKTPVPGKPTLFLDYSFSSNNWVAGQESALNGWSLIMPARDGNPLWAILAVASGREQTARVMTTDWTNPVIVLEDGKDGRSPYIGANGNWWVWDDNSGSYVDTGDPAHGDDGRSPYIGSNGNWWVWDGEKYIDTGVKAEGKDGASTEWGYRLTDSETPPDKPVGDLPNNGFTSVMGSISESMRYLWAVNRIRESGASSFGVWSSPNLHARWGRDGDNGVGVPGIPGQVPVQKEWIAGDKHRNSDFIVDFIYVRGSTASQSYWYQLIDKTNEEGITAGAVPSSGTTPVGYKLVNWMPVIAAKVLIGEEANLANFIFKDGKQLSLRGENFKGDEVDYGEIGEYGFSTSTSSNIPSEWTPLPVNTVGWYRFKLPGQTDFTHRRISALGGEWQLQFADAPDSTAWSSTYSVGKYWLRCRLNGETDWESPEKYTYIGGYDFIPNVIIDGINGIIYGDKVFANNIRSKIIAVPVNEVARMAQVIASGRSLHLKTVGGSTVYGWNELKLPNDKTLSGTIVSIHAPNGGGTHRFKIKSESAAAVFYSQDYLSVFSELQIVQGVVDLIELKGIWNDYSSTLDWHVLSRVSYIRTNPVVHTTMIRTPAVIKANEVMFAGRISVSESTSPSISKRYQSVISQIQADKNTLSTKWVQVKIPIPKYYNTSGSLVTRTGYNSGGDMIRCVVVAAGIGRTASSFISHVSNSYWYVEVAVSDTSGSRVYDTFDIEIYANKYIVQADFMDDTLGESPYSNV